MSRQANEDQDVFWSTYAEAHRAGAPRTILLLSATSALACAAAGLLGRRRWLLPAAPLVAWAGAAVACLASPHPELARTSPWRLVGAGARLVAEVLRTPGPATEPSTASPSGSNGKGRWPRREQPSSPPVDPSTLN